MKKIELLVSQTGRGDEIVQGNLRVKINGKFVKNEETDIVKEAIELNFGCNMNMYLYVYKPYIEIITKSGFRKSFRIPNKFCKFSYTYTREELNKKMQEASLKLHEIEEWILNIHKTTQNFTITAE